MWNLVGEKLSSWVWEQLWYETRGILYTTKTNVENLTNERLKAYEL